MRPSTHRRLTEPSDRLDEHYEHVIVGSGYGASVAALRLAEHEAAAGRTPSVVVLERGREWGPGDFPVDLAGLVAEVRSPLRPLGLVAAYTALSADLDVIGASGLGGTSLINAAIVVRPTPSLWREAEWPRALRDDAETGALEGDFARAESMLGATPHPDVGRTRRSRVHLRTVPQHVPRGPLPLAIHHGAPAVAHGVRLEPCTGCGNCCGGCSVGAKRTLATSYLPAAKARGAALHTAVEVTHLERLPETRPGAPRWLVHYVRHVERAPGLYGRAPGTLTARSVFLGAGSAGTTEILFRSEEAGLALSPALGTRLSANGDVLGAAYNAPAPIGAMPWADPRTPGPERVGPTISAFADLRDETRPLHARFLLLDGVIPRPFVPTAARLLAVHPSAVAGAHDASALARLGRDAVTLDYPSEDGALGHTMILLACGHDSSGGRYVRSGDGVHAVWPGLADERSFRAIHDEMSAYAARLGATFLPNPRSALGGAIQATHPLGGAPMGEDTSTGVVDHAGRVFDARGTRDDDVHPGLLVVDAAAIPRSLAAPPLATITALAERALRLLTTRSSA